MMGAVYDPKATVQESIYLRRQQGVELKVKRRQKHFSLPLLLLLARLSLSLPPLTYSIAKQAAENEFEKVSNKSSLAFTIPLC